MLIDNYKLKVGYKNSLILREINNNIIYAEVYFPILQIKDNKFIEVFLYHGNSIKRNILISLISNLVIKNCSVQITLYRTERK